MLLFALSSAIASSSETLSQAAAYLLKHRPNHDCDVNIYEHAEAALAARANSRWAAAVPWEIFCDNVLPYACLDEPRTPENWRPLLFERCRPLVEGASSTSEAALMLNEKLWDELNVHYEPNLSPTYLAPLDVIESGKASCSGLSLLLVAACRSVGVPARVASVGDWGDGSGNHVWVEVYGDDDGAWHHLGAAEPSALDETWFNERLAREDGPLVYASSYRREDAEEQRFPVPWRDDLAEEIFVPGVEVTGRYRGL